MSKRTILVSGHGIINAIPDQAIVSLGIEKRSADQSQAQQQVTQIVSELLQCCESLAIPTQQIRSAHLDIHPEYHWDKDREQQRLIGYVVRRAIEIKLEELDKIGSLLEQASACGVNQSNAPVFTVKDRDNLYRKALVLASENAHLNAESAAAALDAGVGKVRKIKTVTNPQQTQPRGNMRMMASSAAESPSETYHIGEIKVHARVTVSFELIDS